MRDFMSELKLVSEKDKLFEENMKAADFRFDEKVVNVFDDMVSRSVPFYGEMQRMTTELATYFATKGSRLYDIGCSTGTTFHELNKSVDESVTFVGLDNSEEMLKKAKEKLVDVNAKRKLELEFADINKNINIENASVVTLLLTLQFVRPLNRERIMKKIYDGLNEQGAVIIIEKLTSEDSLVNRLFIEKYYDYKRRNGYSETEITAKREALENVLIPYRMDENFELLRNAGFKNIEVFFRWYNFCGIIAVK
jgi:tRNA (cmo5U34)-methyltransferase